MAISIKKKVFYFRLSTISQDSGITVNHYKSRAEKLGFKPEQIYYDIGSGTTANREQYQHIKELASKGKIDGIVLPDDLSRLTRDLSEFQVVKTLLLNAGVKLYNTSLQEYKFFTPEEDLQSNLLMTFAQFEARRNRYRSEMGHKYIQENGIAMRAVFPYIKEEGKLIPNDTEYKNTGKSVWQIGQELVNTYIEVKTANRALVLMTDKYGEAKNGAKRWEDYTRSTKGFTKWLKSELIRGNIRYHVIGKVVYNTHTPVLSPEQEQRVSKLVEIGAIGRGKQPKIFNIWKGVAYCSCGAKMRVHLKKKWTKSKGHIEYRYLVCGEALTNNQNKRRKIKTGVYIPKCDKRLSYGLRIEKMKELTIDALISRSKELYDYVTQDPVKHTPIEVLELQDQIKQYKGLAEKDPDMIPVLNKKQLQLNQLLESSNIEAAEEIDIDYLRKCLKDFGKSREFWEKATQEELIILFNEFIDRAVCDEGKVTFFFRI